MNLQRYFQCRLMFWVIRLFKMLPELAYSNWPRQLCNPNYFRDYSTVAEHRNSSALQAAFNRIFNHIVAFPTLVLTKPTLLDHKTKYKNINNIFLNKRSFNNIGDPYRKYLFTRLLDNEQLTWANNKLRLWRWKKIQPHWPLRLNFIANAILEPVLWLIN